MDGHAVEKSCRWGSPKPWKEKEARQALLAFSREVPIFKEVKNNDLVFGYGVQDYNWPGALRRILYFLWTFSSPHSAVMLFYNTQPWKSALVGDYDFPQVFCIICKFEKKIIEQNWPQLALHDRWVDCSFATYTKDNQILPKIELNGWRRDSSLSFRFT